MSVFFFQVGRLDHDGMPLFTVEQVQDGVTTVILPVDGSGYVCETTVAGMVHDLNRLHQAQVVSEEQVLEQQRAAAYIAGDAEEEAWLDIALRNANAPVSIRG